MRITSDTGEVLEVLTGPSDMQQRGFVAWNGPIPSQAAVMVTQNEIAVKVPLPNPGPYILTGVTVNVSTGGSTLTAAQNLVTLYSQAGVLTGQIADQSAVWTAAGSFAANWAGGPFTLTGGRGAYCWVGILSNGTTPASFRCVNNSAVAGNTISTGTATGAALYAGRIGAAVTAPASFTPANLVVTNAIQAWIGLY